MKREKSARRGERWRKPTPVRAVNQIRNESLDLNNLTSASTVGGSFSYCSFLLNATEAVLTLFLSYLVLYSPWPCRTHHSSDPRCCLQFKVEVVNISCRVLTRFPVGRERCVLMPSWVIHNRSVSISGYRPITRAYNFLLCLHIILIIVLFQDNLIVHHHLGMYLSFICSKNRHITS